MSNTTVLADPAADPVTAPVTAPAPPAARPGVSTVQLQEARRWNAVAVVVLPVVAAVGAVLSWGSLYAAAAQALGAHAPTPGGVNLAGAAFPLLVDALILGASARYVAGVKTGQPVAGWRLAAHAGVTGTVLLNADAAPTLGDIPWHVTAPIVWSVLVELVARDVLGQLRAVSARRADRIPLRLWLTTPAESVRVSWRMARTGADNADAVRAITERCAAARDDLAAFLPGRRHARTRRQITRRLWAGALDPATLSHLIDTTDPNHPATLHRAVLRAVATGTQPATPLPATPHTAPVGAVLNGYRATLPAALLVRTADNVRTADTELGVQTAPGAARSPGRGGPAGAAARAVAESIAIRSAITAVLDEEPDLPVVEIARQIGRSPRTVRRHLDAQRPAPTQDVDDETGDES